MTFEEFVSNTELTNHYEETFTIIHDEGSWYRVYSEDSIYQIELRSMLGLIKKFKRPLYDEILKNFPEEFI